MMALSGNSEQVDGGVLNTSTRPELKNEIIANNPNGNCRFATVG
jgi:hypothetical protein